MCPRVIVLAGSGLAKAGFCHGSFYYISLSSSSSSSSFLRADAVVGSSSRLRNTGRQGHYFAIRDRRVRKFDLGAMLICEKRENS